MIDSLAPIRKGALTLMISRMVLAALTLTICAFPSPPQDHPPSNIKVFVVGEVMRSGSYVLKAPTTVLKILVDAGGFREHAAVDKIEIVRGERRLKFSYTDLVQKSARDQNVTLLDGDII